MNCADLDEIYTAALMLPPSKAREQLIETVVRQARLRKMRSSGHFHDKLSTCHMLICDPHGGELYPVAQ